jgi:hypothetical protein
MEWWVGAGDELERQAPGASIAAPIYHPWRTTVLSAARRCAAAGALVIPLLAAACHRGPRLAGAVYGDQIPVYPEATFREMGGGSYSDDVGGPVTAESRSWFFTITDGQKAIAFYQEKLPTAARDDDEDGTTFRFMPRGAESGEDVAVVIRKGELQITEMVKPGKRKP